MSDPQRLETRIGALIGAYADRAPILIDPIEMSRLAAGNATHRGPIERGLGWPHQGLVFLLLALALFATFTAGALVAGGELLRRDPALVQPRNPLSVIAHYARIHEGFVFVYDDGRVLLYPDLNAAPVGSGTPRYGLFERRLTQDAIDLVRSGRVPPRSFLHDPRLPDRAWVDAEFRPYQPSRYAVCYWLEGQPADATRVVDVLPASAGALLRGKERTYLETDQGLGGAPLVPCSEVTNEDAHILVDLLDAAGFKVDSTGSEWSFLDAGSFGGYVFGPDWSGPESETEVLIMFQPILPHGTWVIWGG